MQLYKDRLEDLVKILDKVTSLEEKYRDIFRGQSIAKISVLTVLFNHNNRTYYYR